MTENTKKLIVSAVRAAFPDDWETCDLTTLTKRIKIIDRKKHFKLFEAVCAYKFGYLIWENLPCDVLENKDAIRYKRGYPDYGIDAASPDLKEVLQAKHYKPGKSISFRSGSTFSTYSEILDTQKRTLIHSQDVKISSGVAKIKKLEFVEMKDQEFATLVYECLCECREDDLSDFFDDIQPPLQQTERKGLIQVEKKTKEGKEVKDEKLTQQPLRNYQLDAVDQLMESFRSQERHLRLHMACGTGKTATAATFMSRLFQEKKRWAWFVPSIHLLNQAAEMITKWAPNVPIWRVGGQFELKSKEDKSGCIICTYHSVDKLAGREFDVIVVDESHHVEPYLSEEINEAKDEKDLPEGESQLKGYLRKIPRMISSKMLLMSATMEENDAAPADYSYEIETAIRNKHLCDYEICIPVLTSGNVQAALCKLISETPAWSSILAYCNERKDAQEFCAMLLDTGVSAAYFDGTSPIDKRMEIIRDFEKGNYRALVTVYVLGEGVDIPIADTCMFVAPRTSHVNVVQCVGRVLRKHPTKEIAHIVLPTTSEERTLTQFLKIMSQHDHRIARSIEIRRQGRVNLIFEDAKVDAETRCVELFNRMGRAVISEDWEARCKLAHQTAAKLKRFPPRVTKVDGIPIGGWIHRQRHLVQSGSSFITEEKLAKLMAIPYWYVDNSEKWESMFGLLVQYVKEKNTIPPPRAIFSGKNLGNWVTRQRDKKRGVVGQGTLTPDQISRLEAVPKWFWIKVDDWQLSHDELVVFTNKMQRAPKPDEKSPGRGINLYKWISNQRELKKKGKLSKERITSLEGIPFWSWGIESKWDLNYANVEQFISEFKRAPSSRSRVRKIPEHEKTIAIWIGNQRGKLRNKELSEDQAKRFQELLEKLEKLKADED